MDYYKDEYVMRVKLINGGEQYFLQFLSSNEVMPEIEIDYDTYTLYAKEFSKPLRGRSILNLPTVVARILKMFSSQRIQRSKHQAPSRCVWIVSSKVKSLEL